MRTHLVNGQHGDPKGTPRGLRERKRKSKSKARPTNNKERKRTFGKARKGKPKESPRKGKAKNSHRHPLVALPGPAQERPSDFPLAQS